MPGSTSTWDGKPRCVVVVGTTITTPAWLSLSGSADTMTAGRRPDCSCPTGSPKSTSQTSARRGVTTSGRPQHRSRPRARPQSHSTPRDRSAARCSEPRTARRTCGAQGRPQPRRAAESSDGRSRQPTLGEPVAGLFAHPNGRAHCLSLLLRRLLRLHDCRELSVVSERNPSAPTDKTGREGHGLSGRMGESGTLLHAPRARHLSRDRSE